VFSFTLSLTTCSDKTSQENVNKNIIENAYENDRIDSVSFCLRLCDSITEEHYFEYVVDNPVSPFSIVNSLNENNQNEMISDEDVYATRKLSDTISKRSFSKFDQSYFSYEHCNYGVIYIVQNDHLCLDYLLKRHPLLNENQLQSLITFCMKEHADRKAEFLDRIFSD
jgi:hypothetical protein